MALQKEFPQKWKVVKQVKCLLEVKKYSTEKRKKKKVQYMWMDTWADSESRALLSV